MRSTVIIFSLWALLGTMCVFKFAHGLNDCDICRPFATGYLLAVAADDASSFRTTTVLRCMNLLEREGYFGYGPRCNQFYSEHLNAIETRYNTLQTHGLHIDRETLCSEIQCNKKSSIQNSQEEDEFHIASIGQQPYSTACESCKTMVDKVKRIHIVEDLESSNFSNSHAVDSCTESPFLAGKQDWYRVCRCRILAHDILNILNSPSGSDTNTKSEQEIICEHINLCSTRSKSELAAEIEELFSEVLEN